MPRTPALKVWIYLSLMSLAIMYAGLKLGHRHGLLIAFLIALTLNALIFFFSDLRLKKRFETELLEGQDPWGMLSSLDRLARKAQIAIPKLQIIELQTPITVSYGMAMGQNTVLVSRGLVREFTKDELEAALALEIARLARQDTALSTAAAATSAAIGSFARAIDNIVFMRGIRRTRKPFRGMPVTSFFFPLIAIVNRLLIHRGTYLEADQFAAQLIGDKQRIANVLWKLHAFQNTLPFEIKVSDVALFIVSPLESSSWLRKFQPQPPLERRIKVLLGHFPI
jgi:heat shock protein HtpX